jgi:acetoin:2,6-dichlorophenolindophenol oxidoreductase subunit beta
MITYKQELNKALLKLSKNHNVLFVGYNLLYGSKNYGSCNKIPKNKIIETPVSESLMTGMAIGLSLTGYLPVLIFERMDFMLLASDQIINHLDKIESMSNGEFKPKIIIKATVGDEGPPDPGIQHTQDFTNIFENNCKNINIIKIKHIEQIKNAYDFALKNERSSLLIDYRKLY